MVVFAVHGPTKAWFLKRLTGAMLDRLTHKVHIIEANGQSYRLEQSRKRLARQNKIER
jgi:DNA replication protein DnaC